jgi:predicted secreted hydrolase
LSSRLSSRKSRYLPVTLVLIAAAVLAAGLWLVAGGQRPELAAGLQITQVLGTDTAGFERADRPRRFEFPADHGPHPGFRTEWWYFTGNLATAQGRSFGYQLTFFRTGLAPESPERDSAWASSQLYMAHAALSDLEIPEFRAFERFARAALDLAGARAEPFRVWLEDWSAESTGADTFPLRLRAGEEDMAFDLELAPTKPLVLQGEEGLSRKSAEPGSASYYYSYTRLVTTGTIRVGDRTHHVRGTSWLDREWGSGALDRTQVGWDWFGLQLDDGRDLMLGQVRAGQGRAPFRGGTLVASDGRKLALDADRIALDALAHWQSPATGTRYPSRWHIAIPEHALELSLEPAAPNQELLLAIRYWEGAVRAHGVSAGRPVAGVGYAELTGYGETTK